MVQNRDPRNKPMIYGRLIFDKGAKNMQWEKESPQQTVLGILDSKIRKNESDPLPYAIYKSKLKMD